MELSLAKFLLIIIICATNIAVIFFGKSRLNSVIFLIISNLFTILFLSITIYDFEGFKEILLALIIFLTVILSLISSNNEIYLSEELHKKRNALSLKFILFFTIAISCAYFLFQITSQINKTTMALKQEITKQTELENYHQTSAPKAQNSEYKNQYELEKLQMKLPENPLLKRSTDAIFLISAIISCALLFQRRKNITQ